MTRRTLLVFVVALATCAQPAQARYDRGFYLTPGYHMNWPRSIRPALQLAQRVWHPVCTGPLGPNRLVVLVERPDFNASADDLGMLAGWASPGECTIHLPRSTWWMGGPDLCQTVLHEAGHVANFHEDGGPDDGAHSADPNNLMYPVGWVIKGIVRVQVGHRWITAVSWGGVDRRCLRAYGERLKLR